MRLRGELCIGAATFLSFAAVILVIFAHVGQISTSTVPRGLAMMKVNMSGYGIALQTSTGDPVQGLYAPNASISIGEGAGLRELYQFGLYSYCAYVDAVQGTCSNSSAAFPLEPYSVVLADMPFRYSNLTHAFIPGDLTFTNSHYLSEFSRAAYYLLLLGSICAALAMIIGIPKRTYTYLFSTLLAILGTGMLFIGAVIWTVLVNKVQSINKAMVVTSDSTTPLGIDVSAGASLWLFWASFVCLFLSIMPYLVRYWLLGCLTVAVLIVDKLSPADPFFSFFLPCILLLTKTGRPSYLIDKHTSHSAWEKYSAVTKPSRFSWLEMMRT